MPVVVELGDRRLDLLAFGFERADAVADQHRVDAGFDRGELALEALVDVGELVGEALALAVVAVLEFAGEVGVLGFEAGDASGSEDAGGEEVVDQVGDAVLADVLPFAVAERVGGLVAVADAVAAGVVGVAFAGLALHAQGVVASGAVHDPGEQVEAVGGAAARACLAGVASVHLGLDALEPVVGDERLVAVFGLDPVLVVAAHERPVALLDGAEVQPVPVQAAGVDGVFEDRSDRGL